MDWFFKSRRYRKTMLYVSFRSFEIGYIVKLIVNNSSHKDSILLNKFSKLNIEIVELGEESKSRWKKILKFRSIVLSYNPQIILCCNFI